MLLTLTVRYQLLHCSLFLTLDLSDPARCAQNTLHKLTSQGGTCATKKRFCSSSPSHSWRCCPPPPDQQELPERAPRCRHHTGRVDAQRIKAHSLTWRCSHDEGQKELGVAAVRGRLAREGTHLSRALIPSPATCYVLWQRYQILVLTRTL